MRLGWILVPKGESNSYVTLPTVVTTSKGLGGIELNYELTLFEAKFPQQCSEDWSWGDSNPLPHPCKGCALPDELQPHNRGPGGSPSNREGYCLRRRSSPVPLYVGRMTKRRGRVASTPALTAGQ